MKKLFPLALCLCLLALCACGQTEPTSAATPAASTTETQAATTDLPTTGEVLITVTQPQTTQTKASTKKASTTKAMRVATTPAPIPPPEAYGPILDALRILSIVGGNELDQRGDAFTKSANFLNFAGYNYITDNMGYAVVDINGDGTLELVLLNETMHMLALYTLRGSEPIWLTGWTHRSYGTITADGTIYSSGANSASSSILYTHKLEPGADSLTELSYYFYDYVDGQGLKLRESSGGEWRPATEEEITKLIARWDNPPKPMKLTFIPIEQ